MNIKMILYENVPCWYELSWQEKPPALILRIHKDFIDYKNKIILEKSPIVGYLTKEFSLLAFDGDFTKNIGFGGIFKHTGEKGGFIEFMAEIPKVKKKTGKKCQECDGTGKGKWDPSEKCFFCKGSGKEWTMDWKDAITISASLTVLTTWLKYCEIETSAPYPQLLTIQTITQQGLHGGSLSGDISIPLHNWLEAFSANCNEQRSFPEMTSAMMTAYNRMFRLRDYDQYSFNAYITKSGRFITSCPGNACGLNPSDWYENKGHGFEFSCHNTDSPMQQITLLASLAVLHDIARKEIK